MSPIGAAGHRIESTTYKQHIIRLSILFFLRGGTVIVLEGRVRPTGLMEFMKV